MRESIMPCYAPPEVLFTSGDGCYLYADNGDRYSDFSSGIAVNALGHAHPKLVNALREAAGGIWHLSNMFRVDSGEQLANKLTEQTFADRVFFANSGAEANECGLKAIRRYHYDNGRPERYRIIGMSGSFHGRTIATVGASGNPSYTKGFIPTDYGFDQVPFGDIDALKAMIGEHTAGIILEPVQGEGGIKVADPEYLKAVRALCDEHDLVLMFDEVQCGFGRSGSLYAYQTLGVTPDILSSAKGLGGGFPIGACLTNEKIGKHMVIGTHGSTFGGNPLATTVGNVMLDTVSDEAFLTHVRKMSDYLRSELTELSKRVPEVYGEVSGMGLMLGIKVTPENTELLVKMRDEQQVLVVKAGGNSLRFLPPLIVDKAEIDALIKALESVAK
ncbi:aspartate aminotransferase family protein [Suttonella sp. R2A3]|uniref:aspartate aminotransferase family protein n=1 Tax=Suttonella sp. R2A3 TaxID=2908648 RepID=UPI001F3F0F2B|nr:aspartate aminotransferase family protein [Suttonella sp. R2A3]UJF24256.1 aspartate aminotransferase family protein [Suttonella sp. R2A3]